MILNTIKMAATEPDFTENARMENLCKECGKSFAHKSGLCDHERRHKKKAPYKCCGHSFFSKANLTRHRCSAHAEKKRFKCTKCQKEFAILGDLRRHERQEVCGPKLKCDICGSTFYHKNDLKEHMGKHSGEKKYGCACGKFYRYHQGLSRHRKTCKT